MNKVWITHQQYDHNREKVDYKKIKSKPKDYGYKEEQCEKKTVPGQALTVKELMDRYEKGRPIPTE